MMRFEGCGTALVTPLTDGGELDLRALRALVEWQIAEGIDFLVPCGSTGEAQTLSDAEEQAIRGPILEKYEREGSPYYSTARLWDDGIIDPAKTRDVLALSLAACYNAPVPPPRYGVFRM